MIEGVALAAWAFRAYGIQRMLWYWALTAGLSWVRASPDFY